MDKPRKAPKPNRTPSARGLTVTWSQHGTEAIIVQGGFLVNAARMIGLPFLLVGGYLLYQLADGVRSNDLTVVGWVILPVLGAGVALVGWCLLAWRRRARLDNAHREVAEELDFILFRKKQAVPITAESYVRLRYEQGSTSSTQGVLTTHTHTRFDIHVDVVTPHQRDTLIGLFSESQQAQALDLAHKAGAFLALRVRNQMIEGGDVNAGGVVVERSD